MKAPGPETAEAFRRQLTASPTLYPLDLDPRSDRVRFVPLTAADYEAASFLDARLGIPDAAGGWVPWPEVCRAAAGLPERCHFVFHISHAGSTLLARLLGHHPALFAVREPYALRILAEAHLALGHPAAPWDRAAHDERLGTFLALWSRAFSPDQVAVVKATSFASEMATDLLGRVNAARAVLMYVPPATFLAALLDGAMRDIARAAGPRLFRLHRRLGGPRWQPQDFSPGEAVAMSWLSEMLSLHAAAHRFPGRTRWIDFNHFLLAPEPEFTAILTHFGAGDAERWARDILAGPTLGQYAKAPGQKYDAALRDQLLRRGGERHAAELRKGLDWLDRAGAIPQVREVLDLVGQTKS